MVFPKKQRTSVLAMAAATSRFTPAVGLHDEDDFLRMSCYYSSDDGCAQSRLQDKVSLDVISDQHQWQNEGKWPCRIHLSAICAATVTYEALLLGQPATDTYPSRRMAIWYYMNAVAFVASRVIIVLMLIRVGTLRQRHAGIKLTLLGVALSLFYVPVWISRQRLATAIYAAALLLCFFIYLSSVTFALSSTALFLNLLRFLAAEQPAHTSKSPALARVHMARQHRIQRNIQAHIHTLVIIIATLIKGRTPQYSKCTHIQGCISTPNKKKAPSAHEHLLDHMLRSAVSDRTYVRQCNLTEECCDKPRSNSSTPATNSSDDTTRDPLVQNKLNPDGENENHSGPDACVDDRDTSASKGQAKWYMATGAARHATGDSSQITNLVPLEPENGEGLCVHAADGTPMPVVGRGSVVTPDVVLPDVYFVPGLLTNLVSVGQLAGLDYSVGFGRGACVVSSADGETVGRAHAGKDGLYEVEFLRVPLDVR